MKTFITTLLLMCISVSFSQEYYMHDYRMIPNNQIQNHIDNEKHFWSKVAQTLIKEGKLTGWAMLQRQGGSSNEPNFYFYIGIGDKSNLENLRDQLISTLIHFTMLFFKELIMQLRKTQMDSIMLRLIIQM